MIKVTNLTKIYKSKKKDHCVALDNVSFSVPDKGFVFIIGKSGSGKTTLLSIIGGLDNLTSGDVFVNGNAFSSFKEKDFVNYRNSMIGYVFQDFHLIDELTIYENIKVSLDLQQQNDEGKIAAILEKVGLAGYENRYPKELSGGEKQRVAIARAIIKKPRIILADEPTGNLDSKTTSQILTLLKELSKETLVLIVSHNLVDAREYADRIIELSAGKVINDLARNPNYLYNATLVEEELFIPAYKEFDERDKALIDKYLASGKVKRITQTNDIFIENSAREFEEKITVSISDKHLSFKSIMTLALKFLKKDAFRLCLYSLVVACLIMILGLSQLIVNFDSSKTIKKELDELELNSISLYKNDVIGADYTVSKNHLIPVGKEDIARFTQAGYDESIYELVNVVLDYGPVQTLASNHMYNVTPSNNVFYYGTRGTLVTTEDYVKNTFNGLEYLALADTIKNSGIYITDYSADAILYYKGNPHFSKYEDLLGPHKSSDMNFYAHVNGIINTGYKQKHKYIIDKLANVDLTKEELKELVASEDYRAFYDEVVQYLAISYSFNPNFKEDFVASNDRTWVPIRNSLLVKGDKGYENSIYFEHGDLRSSYAINDDEIYMSYLQYNTIFNANYGVGNLSEFVPEEIELKYYYHYDLNRTQVVCSKKLKIARLIDGATSYIGAGAFTELLQINTFTSALYFDDVSNVALISDVAAESGFILNSITAVALTTLTKAVDVFSDFFNLILIGLCACALLILVNYGMRLVKERKYEIGILKALGARNYELTIMFGVQIVVAVIVINLLYMVGSLLLTGFANDVLITSLMELAPNDFMMDLDVLFVNYLDLIRNSILVVIIVFLSFILPFLKLRAYKPLDIVKAKE